MIDGHGGNRIKLAQTLGCRPEEITDMSSNLNPLGPPEWLETFIRDQVTAVRELPEPDAGSMRQAFARFHGLDEKTVLAGNGTTWFIYTLPLALGLKKALIAGPTYADYRDGCAMYGVEVSHCQADSQKAFQPDLDEISRMAGQADAVFICNPNNPTGTLIPKDRLQHLVQSHPRTVFIVDESYLPFVPDAKDHSLLQYGSGDNLIVLSSLSKIFRIPGLRIGFLYASSRIVEQVAAFYQPWSVNALAQAASCRIFSRPEEIMPFIRQTRAFIQAEQIRFAGRLKDLETIRLYDSVTGFILAELSGRMGSAEFCREMGRHRILIRDCANFTGLSDRYVRFSLKNRETNDRLAAMVRQILDHD